DIITVGSATVDVFLRSDAFVVNDRGQESLILSGGKIEISQREMAVGGGGTNTAAGFSRLGLNCACVSRFGTDWTGNWLKESLKRETFDQRYLRQMEGEETDFSTILLSPTGERIILTFRGKTRVDEDIFPFDALPQARWLYLASLEGNVDLLAEIVDRAKGLKVSIVLNPGNLELQHQEKLAKIFPKVKTLVLNEEEAKLFWGKDYLKKLKNAGPEIVVVTCGKDGAYYYQNGEVFREAALGGEVVDATGAGDAFSVGLVAGLIWGQSLPWSVQAGMAESLSVIGQIGPKAGLLTKEELEKKLEETSNR
ncbi:MAG: carbohydrate kinase family protein, partial [Candidatus Shapirobacteria bacterium]|nr:carbohydrate kinase family protein [Candidatus Shapirobacteria bacterium]MDD5073863.1 carbohydrate kinase family protein [Candidatus Shapirobacteria bacterium]MDD5481740.1 carbohydrate kinase family protein [Candidatus Shapirobacteria bacterium]